MKAAFLFHWGLLVNRTFAIHKFLVGSKYSVFLTVGLLAFIAALRFKIDQGMTFWLYWGSEVDLSSFRSWSPTRFPSLSRWVLLPLCEAGLQAFDLFIVWMKMKVLRYAPIVPWLCSLAYCCCCGFNVRGVIFIFFVRRLFCPFLLWWSCDR